MREFEERFGAGARTDLETTFRCSDGLCKLATRFVLGNPAQIEKRVRTVHGVNGPAVWIDFGGDDAPPSLDEALDRIAADVLATEGRPSVFLLGRYRHLKPDMRRLAPKHPGRPLFRPRDRAVQSTAPQAWSESSYPEESAGQRSFNTPVRQKPHFLVVHPSVPFRYSIFATRGFTESALTPPPIGSAAATAPAPQAHLSR